MYQVEWLKPALTELAALWVASNSELRQAITKACNSLEKRLAADPFTFSESREGSLRMDFQFPLGVKLQIDQAKKIVFIAHVWQIKKRNK